MVCSLLAFCGAGAAGAAEFYVAPNDSDQNPG